MAQNFPEMVITEQNLRIMVANLEGQFARLQFEHGRAQGLLQTQRDTILGLKEELEWQKSKTADLEAKLSQTESSKNCEKIQFEQTIKNLTDELDMQNRVIFSLKNEQKIKRPNGSEFYADAVLLNLKKIQTLQNRQKSKNFSIMSMNCDKI